MQAENNKVRPDMVEIPGLALLFLHGDTAVADLLHQASDDQLALGICFGAVLVSGLVMYFSRYVGQMTGRVANPELADSIRPFPSTQSAQAENSESHERAA